MKILSYNTNGIRAAISKGLIEFIAKGDYDIVCIQETKAEREQVNTEGFEALGYHHFWLSAEKKGYSGVAIFSKIKPQAVHTRMNNGKNYDSEGRVIRADFGHWSLLNIYFPSGTSGDERQDVKMVILEDIFSWVSDLRK
ncbi:MAG: exodeoxyribonuclease III, partial [Saprospiraceae bacterium]|nr:exodeoxyribonuclease III [Saprospiraceae bacterium]